MKPRKLARLVIAGAITLMLILGSVPGVYAAGNYHTGDIVWTKTDCSGNWSIWRMNDDGSNAYPLTTWPPTSGVEEHPVYNDEKTQVVFTRNMNIWTMNPTDPPLNPNPVVAPFPAAQIDETTDEVQLTGTGVDNHPYTFDSLEPTIPEKIYFIRNEPGVGREIWRMNMDGSAPTRSDAWGTPAEGPTGYGFSLPLGTQDRWHPTVARYAGSDYLVWLEGNFPGPLQDNRIMRFNLTTGGAPVIWVDGSTVPAGEDVWAPSITPDGTAVLYTQGAPSGLLLYIRKRDWAGTTINLTTGAPDVTPYADYAASAKMDFYRGGEIFWKSGLGGLAPAPINISNDPANVDTIVVEPSGCNPVPLKPAVPINTVVTGFALMVAGSMMLFWQRRRRSLIPA